MTIIEHNIKGVIEFESAFEFRMSVQALFKKRDGNNGLVMPTTYDECVLYIYAHCDNIKVIQSKANYHPIHLLSL